MLFVIVAVAEFVLDALKNWVLLFVTRMALLKVTVPVVDAGLSEYVTKKPWPEGMCLVGVIPSPPASSAVPLILA